MPPPPLSGHTLAPLLSVCLVHSGTALRVACFSGSSAPLHRTLVGRAGVGSPARRRWGRLGQERSVSQPVSAERMCSRAQGSGRHIFPRLLCSCACAHAKPVRPTVVGSHDLRASTAGRARFWRKWWSGLVWSGLVAARLLACVFLAFALVFSRRAGPAASFESGFWLAFPGRWGDGGREGPVRVCCSFISLDTYGVGC